ncbi:hypothetical protein WA158_007066 [Blastocystis sp. Blastoise]
MSDDTTKLSEDKYLFTFQDETQLWVPTEFIEKYRQLPFYDIIVHSEKYEDGSYYIDIPFLTIKKVLLFLIEDCVDINSLDLKDSYDIYNKLLEYPDVIDSDIKSDLLYHIQDRFTDYLIDNSISIADHHDLYNNHYLSIELFSSSKIKSIEDNHVLHIYVSGLFTIQLKDELIYYSYLIKMMNITKVEIEYDYASSIPLEYILPSCIKDIFPSLKILTITLNTHYKKSELLLNPNSDEYLMEYIRLYYSDEDEISKYENYNYYTESEMNEYNNISSININYSYYSQDMIDSYNEKREKNELPKLYAYIVNEAIYTNDYSNVEISETKDEYTSNDQISIEYNDKTNDKAFIINEVSSKLGISQLLGLSSCYSISQIKKNTHDNSKYKSIIIMKLFEEGVFDSLTTFCVGWIKELTHKMYNNLFKEILATHIFPNVTELIYNDNSFQLSLIKKEYFPKLHIINYMVEIYSSAFESLFPMNIISIIDIIHMHENCRCGDIELIVLDNLIHTHSIHIDGIDDNDNDNDNDKNNDNDNDKNNNDDNNNHNNNNNNNNDKKNNNDYDDTNKNDIRNSIEKFMKSNILENINSINVSFDDNMSIKYLEWISNLFNDNKYNTLHDITINLYSIEENLSSEYLTMFENIMGKLICMASIVTIEDNYINIFKQMIYQMIALMKCSKTQWWISFIKRLLRFINNINFPSSSAILLNGK